MKEAIGDLNMTVVVVIIVAGLSLFFFTMVWPKIQGNFAAKTRCDAAICTCPKRDGAGKCVVPEDGLVTCKYRDKTGAEHDITCVWKG